MVTSCSAINCVNRHSKEKSQSFYRFPLKNLPLLEKWLLSIRRQPVTSTSLTSSEEDHAKYAKSTKIPDDVIKLCQRLKSWIPGISSHICSDHFLETDFIVSNSSGYRMLKDDAVPTIFNFPGTKPQKVSGPRPPPKDRTPASSVKQSIADSTHSIADSTHSIASVADDHGYATNPGKVKRKLNMAVSDLAVAKKKIKISKQTSNRRLEKGKSLKSVFANLRDQNLVYEAGMDLLETCFSGIALDLFKNKMLKTKRKKAEYSASVKQFALTLHYLSPKAYDYVSQFISLPCPRILRKWSSVVTCDPGFTAASFEQLKRESDKAKHTPLCSLIIDEIPIRQDVCWDDKLKKYIGFVDVGQSSDDDSLPMAKSALTFMAVAVNGNWKLPLGYFFIDDLPGSVKSNFVMHCLEKLHEANVKCINLTCDGEASNLTMLKQLGVQFIDSGNSKPWFPHPSSLDDKVYVMLDAGHMIKLMRNMLAEKFLVVNSLNGNVIEWGYLKMLHQLQEKEGLHAANKLGRNHIDFCKQKMKVKLADQVFSNSIANSLHLCKSVGIAGFSNSDETAYFLKLINDLLDIMNSRSRFAKGYTAPLQAENKEIWLPKLLECREVLFNLRVSRTGDYIWQSKRKVCIIGFIANIDALIGLAATYLDSEVPVLNYILTYKLRQEHLEIFFSNIRMRGGHNDNPNCAQFMASYRKILGTRISKSCSGYCVNLDNGEILSLQDAPVHHVESDNSGSIKTLTIDSIGGDENLFEITGIVPEDFEDDLVLCNEINYLSKFADNSFAYIAGFVVRKISAKLTCDFCIDQLIASEQTSLLVSIKDNCGLIMPSRDLVKVCQVIETVLRQIGYHKPTSNVNAFRKINYWVFRALADIYVFDSIRSNCMALEVDSDSHYQVVVKFAVEVYLKVRLHYAAKKCTSQNKGQIIRQHLSKTIIFKG